MIGGIVSDSDFIVQNDVTQGINIAYADDIALVASSK